MSTTTAHAPRRDPEAPAEPFDLAAAAAKLLEQARGATSGRAARNLMPGNATHLSQTMLALLAGHDLQEHVAPGPATIQVLSGRGRLHDETQDLVLAEGQWATIPARRHGLAATEDLVVLLTVANDHLPATS